MHELYELKEKLCRELEEYGKKDLSAGGLEVVDKLAHTVKNLDKIIENYEESEYSGNMGDSYARGGSYRYDGGMSYARGRGSRAKRDSMGRYSSERGYSRDAADMTAELQEMMDDPKYAPVKHDIERLMRKVETM